MSCLLYCCRVWVNPPSPEHASVNLLSSVGSVCVDMPMGFGKAHRVIAKQEWCASKIKAYYPQVNFSCFHFTFKNARPTILERTQIERFSPDTSHQLSAYRSLLRKSPTSEIFFTTTPFVFSFKSRIILPKPRHSSYWLRIKR
jgi:hypothetical protein